MKKIEKAKKRFQQTALTHTKFNEKIPSHKEVLEMIRSYKVLKKKKPFEARKLMEQIEQKIEALGLDRNEVMFIEGDPKNPFDMAKVKETAGKEEKAIIEKELKEMIFRVATQLKPLGIKSTTLLKDGVNLKINVLEYLRVNPKRLKLDDNNAFTTLLSLNIDPIFNIVEKEYNSMKEFKKVDPEKFPFELDDIKILVDKDGYVSLFIKWF